jgi:hypothetical protein
MANGRDTSASQFSADWLVAGFAEGNSREPSSQCRDGPWSIPNIGRRNVRFGSFAEADVAAS